MQTITAANLNLSEKEIEALRSLTESIRLDPELSFQEFNACKRQVEFLKECGFAVVTPCYGLDTAYRAEFSSGKGTPVFAFCSEYDALPGVGHGCGHHLICGASLAAALHVKHVLEEYQLDGKVVILGCPGEETEGGKVEMAERGALDGIDALMMAHPTGGTAVICGEYSGVCSAEVTFTAEKAGSPVARCANPEFTNPLDAQVLLYQSVALRRHYMPFDSAISGCIPDGGVRANMIPSQTKSVYTLRSSDIELLKSLGEMFRDMAKGAALMTGTQVDVRLSMRHQPTLPALILRDEYLDNMDALGFKTPDLRRVYYGAAGTDFGNFSRLRPGVHGHFPLGQIVAAHTLEFAELSASESAYTAMFSTAKAMALTALKYLRDPEFRRNVNDSFAQSIKPVNSGND